MSISNNVIISKRYLLDSLVEKEDIAKSLSRFVENSLKAKALEVTKDPCPCIVKISFYEDLILISDNSGGIDDNLTDIDIFKIGVEDKNEIVGLGLKKSSFRLGNKIDIISNKRNNTKKFILDLTLEGEPLISEMEDLDFDNNQPEGTSIYISELNENIIKELKVSNGIFDIGKRLGRIFHKFIYSGDLVLNVDGHIIKEQEVDGEKIATENTKDGYEITLYKLGENEQGGAEIFINDFLLYNREEGKSNIQWNKLTEAKYRFSNCLVEIYYKGSKKEFLDNSEKIYCSIRKFIKTYKEYFVSKTVILHFEMPIELIEELKVYCDVNSAKGIGEVAVNKLYENYKNDIDNKKWSNLTY